MFRFTIRDLLWLQLVVALAVGWWLERANLIPEIERLQFAEDLRKIGPPPEVPENDPRKEPNVTR